MKKYEVNKKKEANSSINFYLKIIFSLIIFIIVVILCRINQNMSNYVKDVLNNSYNFTVVSEKTIEIIDNIKNAYKNIENSFAWEE